MGEVFRKFANTTSLIIGSPWAFILAVCCVLAWAICGPLFGFSDTWQLVINTSTTIITFLIVFLIQNSQNRDARALHLKLDELLRAVHGARNHLIDLEDLTDKELADLQHQFEQYHQREERNAGQASKTSKRNGTGD